MTENEILQEKLKLADEMLQVCIDTIMVTCEDHDHPALKAAIPKMLDLELRAELLNTGIPPVNEKPQANDNSGASGSATDATTTADASGETDGSGDQGIPALTERIEVTSEMIRKVCVGGTPNENANVQAYLSYHQVACAILGARLLFGRPHPSLVYTDWAAQTVFEAYRNGEDVHDADVINGMCLDVEARLLSLTRH